MVKTLPLLIITGLLTSGCSVFSGSALKAPCDARPTASLDAHPCGPRQPVNTALTTPSRRKSVKDHLL